MQRFLHDSVGRGCQLAQPSPGHPCPPYIGPNGHQHPPAPWSARATHASRASIRRGLGGDMAGPLAMSLANWILCSLMPEEGRERWGRGGREPEKRSCLFCCSVCSTSSPAPIALTPEAAVAKGHIPGTLGLGELRTGSLPSSESSQGEEHSGSGGQREGLLCHLLAV